MFMHWKSPNSLRQKKPRMSRSKLKAMMIVFFDIRGIVYVHWVPEGQAVNQHYYIQVLRERVRRRRYDLWKTKLWKIHQDNEPTHSALSVKAFFAKQGITVLEHPPYSPDLAPTKVTEVLNQLTEADFQHCFQHRKSRMERCRDRQGEYIDGEIVDT
ncbi:hypothetical protein NQ318_006815 [Aromia moschata]|uniref:Transposase n=1 Tax=Aromia moschata TaxID=1265417 RepID=A0AAV8XU50_9CUCU|nr:hypothetical protein NQ318_006815 [Aromia moschata]